jgi:hypothetical protein
MQTMAAHYTDCGCPHKTIEYLEIKLKPANRFIAKTLPRCRDAWAFLQNKTITPAAMPAALTDTSTAVGRTGVTGHHGLLGVMRTVYELTRNPQRHTRWTLNGSPQGNESARPWHVCSALKSEP